MRIFDVSLTLGPALPVWLGDPKVALRQTMSLDAGDVGNVSHLSCSVHTGTHVGAPSHFIKGGITVEELPLDVLVGLAYVGYIPDADHISVTELESLDLPRHTRRLLLRTRNSELWAQEISEFTPDYVALTPEAAEWIVSQGLQLVGVDYLSVQRFCDAEPTTHRTLLAESVPSKFEYDFRYVGPYSDPGMQMEFTRPAQVEGQSPGAISATEM